MGGYITRKDTYIEYLHGVDGITGFTVEGKAYYFHKNVMGDVLSVHDENGNPVGSYEYDAWGRVLSATGEMAEFNAIRYRGGYYYDVETRYYDPEIGRFVNMDEINILDESKQFVNGLNLFVYANNNPVMNIDEDGRFWRRLFGWIATAVIAVVAVAAIVVGTITFNVYIRVTGVYIISPANQIMLGEQITLSGGPIPSFATNPAIEFAFVWANGTRREISEAYGVRIVGNTLFVANNTAVEGWVLYIKGFASNGVASSRVEITIIRRPVTGITIIIS